MIVSAARPRACCRRSEPGARTKSRSRAYIPPPPPPPPGRGSEIGSGKAGPFVDARWRHSSIASASPGPLYQKSMRPSVCTLRSWAPVTWVLHALHRLHARSCAGVFASEAQLDTSSERTPAVRARDMEARRRRSGDRHSMVASPLEPLRSPQSSSAPGRRGGRTQHGSGAVGQRGGCESGVGPLSVEAPQRGQCFHSGSRCDWQDRHV